MNHKKLLIVLFFAIIVLLPMATFLLPKSTFSEMENRTLAKAPKITGDSLMDKSYMKNAETFLSDHMVFRTEFASAKTKLELLQGRKEVNGVFISDDMFLEKVINPDKSITNGNIDAINKFAAKYKGKIDTSIMLVPTAVEFYHKKAPMFADMMDQTQYVQDFYAKLKNINCVDAYTPLAAMADTNYIFYRTDHHWTSYGAYVGYTSLARTLGYKSVVHDMFNIEHTTDDFYGTLYSKVLYGEELADKIDLYYYSNGDVVTDVVKYTVKNKQTYPSIFFREFLEQKDKYSVFLGGNDMVVDIQTNVNNGKNIIIFKDSYSHAMMQFLPLHYEKITLVDLRYLNKPLEEYVDLSEYQQALFLYNVAGFSEDSSLKKVANY